MAGAYFILPKPFRLVQQMPGAGDITRNAICANLFRLFTEIITEPTDMTNPILPCVLCTLLQYKTYCTVEEISKV